MKNYTEDELREIHYGCFDSLHGFEISMTLDDALSGSHPGSCNADVACLARKPAIAAQLDAFGKQAIAAALKESGAYDETALEDHAQNRLRAVWFACCNIREQNA